jgi:hypothetical protein
LELKGFKNALATMFLRKIDLILSVVGNSG